MEKTIDINNLLKELGELNEDESIVKHVTNMQQSLITMNHFLEEALKLKEKYEELSQDDKIELDLFLLYLLNSFYWMRLRINGVDTKNHWIKNEINRVRDAMKRWQDIKDRLTIRPKLDKNVAGRFIKSGLWDPNQSTDSPPNKRVKFDN